jgi:transposase-like protein
MSRNLVLIAVGRFTRDQSNITKAGHSAHTPWPRLARAAKLAQAAVEETLACYAFPEEHCRRIRTNNPLERILREIRRRTRVVGAFSEGQSALNLAAVRLRIAGSRPRDISTSSW